MPKAERSRQALIVEDDEALGEVLALALDRHGWASTVVHDGAVGLDRAVSEDWDLVLLDVLLPSMDGLEVCRRLRERSDVPVIVITAKGELSDVVAGLDCGADDYLTKPFEVDELLARMRAVLRRGASSPGERIVIGSLEIRPDEAQVSKGGARIRLTATEFRLLLTLAVSPGRVFSREDLLREVWGWDYLGESGMVVMAVKRLREKVEDDPSRPQLIETIRGFGYRLQPPEPVG